METTEGHLLNGRVRYVQPKAGFRSGLEPVLLAAAIPARAGQRVLEGGSGAGAGLLCLTARLPEVAALGIEREASLAELARRNAAANGFHRIDVIATPIEAMPETGVFDHAFANPPFHVDAGTVSPLPSRGDAKHAAAGVFSIWAISLAARLRPRGTLTLIAPAAVLPDCVMAMARAGCGSMTLLPLWPCRGRAAKLMVMQGVLAGNGASRILPGLVLHEATGEYTQEATAVLRHGASLAV